MGSGLIRASTRYPTFFCGSTPMYCCLLSRGYIVSAFSSLLCPNIALLCTDLLLHNITGQIQEFEKGAQLSPPSLPLSSPSLLLPSSSVPFPLPSLPLPLEVGPHNPARGSGECCKLPSGVWAPQQGLGQSPGRKRILAYLKPRKGIWWQGFRFLCP